MIKTLYQVCLKSISGKETVLLETQDAQLAKQRDSEIEMAEVLLVEAGRLVGQGSVPLPETMTIEKMEPFLEALFLSFAANKDGMKRAIKGHPYTLEACGGGEE